MMRVLTVLLIVVGIAAGGALGFVLKPSAGAATAGREAQAPDPHAGAEPQYVKFGRKLVVPVVEGATTRALMVIDLGIDVPAPLSDRVHAMEPRLRDAFMRVLFQMSADAASTETYIDARILEELRVALLAAAREHAGSAVRDVLILDMIRKEL